ncbi:MAG: lamin tail domain-containing protein, partial [Myxococcales bacterium]|nr:lamin tail domain-containing protein [Myxococcales bacterium]
MMKATPLASEGAMTHSRKTTAGLPFRVITAMSLLATVAMMTACGSDGDEELSCQSGLIFGDLVITELLANPKGADREHEWIEIYNATSNPVDLKGVRLMRARADGSGSKTYKLPSLIIEAGDWIVLGNRDNDETTLPAFVDHGYGKKLGDMGNSVPKTEPGEPAALGAGKLSLKCNSTVVDEVIFGAAKDGVSWQLSSLKNDATANDSAANWCLSTAEHTSADTTKYEDFKGTPGAANRPCSVAGKCLDNGEPRLPKTPQKGEVLINEVMFNPIGSETSQEWIELVAKADVDLNGLEFGKVST